MPYPELIQFLMEAMHQETMKPYIRLSMELIAMAFYRKSRFLELFRRFRMPLFLDSFGYQG